MKDEIYLFINKNNTLKSIVGIEHLKHSKIYVVKNGKECRIERRPTTEKNGYNHDKMFFTPIS